MRHELPISHKGAPFVHGPRTTTKAAPLHYEGESRLGQENNAGAVAMPQ